MKEEVCILERLGAGFIVEVGRIIGLKLQVRNWNCISLFAVYVLVRKELFVDSKRRERQRDPRGFSPSVCVSEIKQTQTPDGVLH